MRGPVSLFVADLAYDVEALTDQAKVGIFAGSLVSAVVGSALLRSGRRLSAGDQELPDGETAELRQRGAEQGDSLADLPVVQATAVSPERTSWLRT